MTQLNEKGRDDVRSLLQDHQNASDALFNLGKSNFYKAITVSNEDDNDYNTVELQHIIAKKSLTEQKKWIETELEKLGIEIV